MQTIKVALLDDEPASTKTLQLLLKKHCPQIEVVATYNHPAKALKEIPDLDIDLLFLDIEMPVMTGFDLLAKLQDYNGSVIFVIAHNNYAIRAFKFSAVDYLLKPVEGEDLKNSVERFINSRQKRPAAASLKELEGNIGYMQQPFPKKIILTNGGAIDIVIVDDIEYIKSDGRNSDVKRTGKSTLKVAKTLTEFEVGILPPNLLRVHASYIVNMEKVDQFQRSDGILILNDGTKISVGRSHRDAVLNYLKV